MSERKTSSSKDDGGSGRYVTAATRGCLGVAGAIGDGTGLGAGAAAGKGVAGGIGVGIAGAAFSLTHPTSANTDSNAIIHVLFIIRRSFFTRIGD